MEMLKGVLLRMLPPDICVKYIVFDGKQDLEKQMTLKLRGWNAPNSVFLIMRDQDAGDCKKIKHYLVEKSVASNKQNGVIIRIACRELESFYLGDLSAVEQGLNLRGIAKQQVKSKYRMPDKLVNPSEILEKLSEKKYQKIAGSRAIAPHLNITGGNKSHSFNVLLDGIRKIIA